MPPSPLGTSTRDAHSRRAAANELYREAAAEFAVYESISAQVIALRAKHDLTQQALADRTGTTKSAISRLESGSHAPTVQTLYKVARAFDLSLTINFTTASPKRKPAKAKSPVKHRLITTTKARQPSRSAR